MRTFADLLRLLEREPRTYRAEIEKLNAQDPARFDAFIDYLRGKIAESNESEDTPLTQAEVDDLLAHTSAALGWSPLRVMAEGLLRVRAAALRSSSSFAPMTPDERPAAKQRYLRRHSSLRALVLADVQAQTAKTKGPVPVTREEPSHRVGRRSGRG